MRKKRARRTPKIVTTKKGGDDPALLRRAILSCAKSLAFLHRARSLEELDYRLLDAFSNFLCGDKALHRLAFPAVTAGLSLNTSPQAGCTHGLFREAKRLTGNTETLSGRTEALSRRTETLSDRTEALSDRTETLSGRTGEISFSNNHLISS